MYVCIGDVDTALGIGKVREMEAVLEKKRDDCVVDVLEGAMHGFACRANPNDGRQVECQMIAERRAIEFFGKWL